MKICGEKMKKEEVKQVIELRKYVIETYNKLDGRTAPGTAIIKQKQVAVICEDLVRMIDNILKDHVDFS
jgi:hypothetical protein